MVAYRQSFDAYTDRGSSATDELNRNEAARIAALGIGRLPVATTPASAAIAATPYRWDGQRYWNGTHYWNGAAWIQTHIEPQRDRVAATAAMASLYRWDGQRYWSGTQYWSGSAWVEGATSPSASAGLRAPAPAVYEQAQGRGAYGRYAATARYASLGAVGNLPAPTDPATVPTTSPEQAACERFRGLMRQAVHFCADRIHQIGKSTTDVESICMRMMSIESGGQVNPGGSCIGLMQLQAATARATIRKYNLPVSGNLLDPQTNIMCGVNYYVDMLEMFGSYRTACAAYNWGPGHSALESGDEARYPYNTRTYVDIAMG